MNDDEPRIRQAFREVVLPAAPEALGARLEEIARRPVPVRHLRWRPWGLAVPATAILLVTFAVAFSGGGRLAQPTGGLAHFDEGGLAFDYPAAWRVFHFEDYSSFSSAIAFLATVEVPAPCATKQLSGSTEIDCADRYVLTPDSLVVAVSTNGMPGFEILNRPAGATPLVVDGLPAYFETGPTASGGDTETLTWTLARPGSVDNYYTIRATVRGPNLAPFETALQAVVASLRFNPPVVPLPSGPGAAETAAAAALSALGKDSPTWACFPAPGGTRQMEIRALTNGPSLARPQVATCTTEILATPLQLWRMTLTLRLPETDPQAGHGEIITVWVNPDGSPGSTGGSSLP